MDADLARIKSAVARFERSVVDVDSFSETLAGEYDRLKRALATSFQSLALEAVPREQYRLADAKATVVKQMYHLFEGRADSSLFVIRGYVRPHSDIYALLASREGDQVPGWRIRLLSGDKIHTERRTRELRDLGLAIQISDSEQGPLYSLSSRSLDATYGAAFQLRKNAEATKKFDRVERARMVELAEKTADLPERRTNIG